MNAIHSKQHKGFTLVELLIVIVIIAILAAISIVSYNGLQKKATEATLMSDLKNASTELEREYSKTMRFPGTDNETTDGSSLPKSDITTYQYTRSNNGQSYCLTATTTKHNASAFMISSDDTTPREGVCDGHSSTTGDDDGEDTTDPTYIANNTPIQNITTDQCQALPIYTGSNTSAIRTVTDSRGGTTRYYEIAKLADNNCWMLTNLKLGGSSPITLTPEDSDVVSNFTLPALITSGGISTDIPYAYGPVSGDTESGSTNYGYLYNFPAATAGKTRATLPANGGNSNVSICPANWRLPVGGTGGDFAQLDISFGGNGQWAGSGQANIIKWQYAGPFRGVFSGAWYHGFSSQSSTGLLWSSSAYTSGNSYAFGASFDLNPDRVGPGSYNGDRLSGLAVRCLLN